MSYILQVDFPYQGPFAEEMSTAMSSLAADIASEEGLVWKIWTENSEEHTAGGIYLFDNQEDAERYLQKHTQRLQSFGITNIRGVIFKVNQPLSHMTKAPV